MLALVGACFNPRYQDPTCGPGGACPSGLTCIEGVCRVGGGSGIDDAATDGDDTDSGLTDAAVDMMVMPDAVITMTFQDGVGGYTQTADTYLDGASPTTTRGTDTNVRWRYESTKERSGLVRFDGIFGAGAIPTTATIMSATLTVNVENNNATGIVSEPAIPWDEATVTFDTFGADPGVDAGDINTVNLGQAPTMNGSRTIDVKSSIDKWRMDPTKNYGWIFIPTAAGGAGDSSITSSEGLTMANRPKLSVTYY